MSGSSAGLQGLLGVFQKLIASKAHDHEGFFILSSVVEFLPQSAFAQYLPKVWSSAAANEMHVQLAVALWPPSCYSAGYGEKRWRKRQGAENDRALCAVMPSVLSCQFSPLRRLA